MPLRVLQAFSFAVLMSKRGIRYNIVKLAVHKGKTPVADQVRLELDREQADYLDDILTMWIDGYDHTMAETEADRSIDDIDDYVRVVGSLPEQKAMATEIRYRLREQLYAGT